MKVDVIVIGGGPSGLMAAIAAATHGAQTILIDKGNKLGRKLGISGGGRCNVTNAKELPELIKNIPGNGRFLHSALATFGNQDIIRFFEQLGIKLKEEDNGRMFPVTDKAKTVVDTLINKAKQAGVQLMVNQTVREVLFDDEKVVGVKLSGGQQLFANSVIIATGGKSVPQTGSTGDGYPWAKTAGHTITDLYPTEVPIKTQDAWIKSRELQGLSLRQVLLTVWNEKGKRIVGHEGDLIFTHFGLSGPIALRCSQYVVKQLKKMPSNPVQLTIDLFPTTSEQELNDQLWQLCKNDARKAIKNILKSIIQERLLQLLFRLSSLDPDTTFDHLSKITWKSFIQLVKDFPIQATGTLSIEEAFVTGGGVHVKEIDPRTMESKLKQGLFFCGEILDVHGYTGGYNITAAFATGYTAGKSAAQMISH